MNNDAQMTTQPDAYTMPMPVASSELQANLYAGSAGGYAETSATGSNLFIWITLTMLWVLMILSILALLKYVTTNAHSEKPARRSSK